MSAVWWRESTSVRWNGSATFSLERDDQVVSVHTRYGERTPGGPCTLVEAAAYARELLDEAERDDVAALDVRRTCLCGRVTYSGAGLAAHLRAHPADPAHGPA